MTKNYNEMTMKELNAEMSKKQKELDDIKKICTPLLHSFETDMREWMTNLMRDTNIEIEFVRTDYIRMRVPGKNRHEINLRLEEKHSNGYDAPEINAVSIDTWSIGNISNGDVEGINYVLAMAELAKNLDAILAKFENSKVLAKLNDEKAKERTISWEMRRINEAMRCIEINAKKEAARKELKPGVVLCTSKCKGSQATVVKVSEKCVFLDEGGWSNARYKMDQVVEYIALGYWEITVAK